MTRSDNSTRFTTFLVIIATPFALGAFLLSSIGNEILKEMNPKESGYAVPRDMSTLIENSQNSTVIIECKKKLLN